MARKIILPPSTQPRLILPESTQPRLDPAEVARALGGEPIPATIEGNTAPVVLYALRKEIMRRRQSTATRSGVEGSEPPQVPVSEADWKKLEEIAASMSEKGFSPSPGQVASVLLSVAIQIVKQSPGTEANGNPLLDAITRELTAR